MDTMVLETTFAPETETTPQPLEMVPLPTLSDLMEIALKDGWLPMHGVYKRTFHKSGCALGAVRHGLGVAGLAPPFTDANPAARGREYIQCDIRAALPHVSVKTLDDLETLFEVRSLALDECITRLRDNDS